MDAINEINFSKIKSNREVISYYKNLNEFIKNPKAKIKIHIQPLLKILRFLNKFINLPTILDRLLTLTAFNHNSKWKK